MVLLDFKKNLEQTDHKKPISNIREKILRLNLSDGIINHYEIIFSDA